MQIILFQEIKFFNPYKPLMIVSKDEWSKNNIVVPAEIQNNLFYKERNINSNQKGLLSYKPLPVRKEFEQPITLLQLKNIDYKKDYHFKPQKYSDSLAYGVVKFLRSFADLYFQKNYVNRAITLETIAAVPGMVGGLYRHLFCLRSQKDNGEIIHKLLKEAENERQHLLTFLEVGKLRILDKIIIKGIQPVFFTFYMMFYLLFPRTAHRFVGYLEEEAIRSYDAFEEEILNGHIENVEAPEIAKEYWKLPCNSRLIDVVRAVRADEAAHRDANHKMANFEPFSLEK